MKMLLTPERLKELIEEGGEYEIGAGMPCDTPEQLDAMLDRLKKYTEERPEFDLERLINGRKMRTHCTKWSNDELLDEVVKLFNKYYLPEIEAKDKQIAKLADNLIDAACDLSSCPNMEFKEYMKVGREALGETE